MKTFQQSATSGNYVEALAKVRRDIGATQAALGAAHEAFAQAERMVAYVEAQQRMNRAELRWLTLEDAPLPTEETAFVEAIVARREAYGRFVNARALMQKRYRIAHPGCSDF